MTKYSEADPYLDPHTGILRNLLGHTDQGSLDRAEGDFVTVRLLELAHHSIEGGFDIPHLRSIHRQLFADVYEWAGQFRTVGIAPFREGNGRTQREFIRQVGVKAGFEITWTLVTQQEITEASIASYNGNLKPLTALILASLTDLDQGST